MEKKNQVRAEFSTMLCILVPAILLCAAPCDGQLFLGLNYYDGDEYNVTEALVNDIRAAKNLGEGGLGYLEIGTGITVNLYTSADNIYLYKGSVLNIYSGSVEGYISLSIDEPYAEVTVYGTDFAIDGNSVSAGQVPINGAGDLTVTYEGTDKPVNLKFWSNKVPIYLVETAANEVEIDIKPGSYTNSINLDSKGVIPVAVLSKNGFAADEEVDPDSVLFAEAAPVRWTLEDVDGNGEDDMLFHFKTQELINLNEDSTDATLTGNTTDGKVIQGTDKVRIVPRICIVVARKKKK